MHTLVTNVMCKAGRNLFGGYNCFIKDLKLLLTDVNWIKRYIIFHSKRHPQEMSGREIEEFLTHLA